MYNVKLEEYRSSCKAPEDMETILDHEFFGSSMLDNISYSEIQDIREQVKKLKKEREYFEWLG